MDFKDFIDNNFNDHNPADLKKLIEFLEDDENYNKLFQYWNSLENIKMPASISEGIFVEVIEEIRKSETSIFHPICF